MSPERWERMEELFHQAADLAPDERAVFLDHECAGDDDLRRAVESLLAQDASRNDTIQEAIGRVVEQLPDDLTRSRHLAGSVPPTGTGRPAWRGCWTESQTCSAAGSAASQEPMRT